MELGIKNRLVLASILPQEANFAMHKTIEILRCDLSFSDEEMKEFEIVINGAAVKWDDKKEERPKQIEIGPTMTATIISILTKLNETNKLRAEHLDLYRMFVVDQPA